jgi:hypothetical protein
MAEVYLFSKFQIPTTAKMVPMGEVGGGGQDWYPQFAARDSYAAIPATDGQRREGLQVAPIGQNNVVIRPGLGVYPQPTARGKHQAYLRTQVIVAQVLRWKCGIYVWGKSVDISSVAFQVRNRHYTQTKTVI